MKNRNWLAVILFVILQAELIGLFVFGQQNQKSIAVVNLEELFEHFEYSEELEGKVQEIDKRQTAILDSLELQLTNLAEQIKITESETERAELNARFNSLRALYQNKNQRFAENLDLSIKQFDKKIWNQIKAYSKSYCEEKNMDIVFGFDERKSVLYNTDKENITQDLINYINQKHQGN